jgi:hypothetical protein
MVRKKPSIRIKQTKNGLEIIKTMYDSIGNVIAKQVENVPIKVVKK